MVAYINLFKRTASATVALLFSGVVAVAEIGTEFSKMPVGCSWTVKYSNGNHWRETYVGVKNGLHVTETVEVERPSLIVNSKMHNSDGLMVYRDWPGKGWEKFSPYSCFGVSASCKYEYSSAEGDSFRIEDRTTLRGKTFTVRSGIVGGKDLNTETFKLGPFKIQTENRSKTYSAKVTSFANCGVLP